MTSVIIGYFWPGDNIEALKSKHINSKTGFSSHCSEAATVIESDVWLLPNSVICTGAILGSGTWCDVGTFIGERSKIGKDSWIHYGARIYNDVKIGSNCNIGGFICNRAILGSNVTSFGSLIHRLDEGYRRINDKAADDEPSPVIEDNVLIGWNTLLIGGITIANGARIGAQCIITKNVEPNAFIEAGLRF